jgi:hypothetical protein
MSHQEDAAVSLLRLDLLRGGIAETVPQAQSKVAVEGVVRTPFSSLRGALAPWQSRELFHSPRHFGSPNHRMDCFVALLLAMARWEDILPTRWVSSF